MVLEKTMNHEYNQEKEKNEYRYIYPSWLDSVAQGLTKGAVKYPGQTWKKIPADEHLARAMRHINLYRMGDRNENHLTNASMRLMMAFYMAEREDFTSKGETVHDIVKTLPNGAEVHRYRNKNGAEISAIYSIDAHGRKDFYMSCCREGEESLVKKYLQDIAEEKNKIRSRVVVRELQKGIELHRYYRENDAYSAVVIVSGKKPIEICACKIDDEKEMLKDMGYNDAND